VVRAKDGYIGVNPLSQTHRQQILRFMGIPELLEDPRFQTTQGWAEHAQELADKALSWFAQRGKDDTMREAQARHIPINLVPTVGELIESCPQYEARGFLVAVEQPQVGRYVQPGAPFIMAQTPWQMRRPAPRLGEHNREVYRDLLGFSDDALVALRANGVI
jgi:crotonobetainyl-CoA:carnitine CoA-transferase CaiB-like acyl-CoA transferase